MSHNLDMSTGEYAIAYNKANGVPWHRHGEAKPAGVEWDAKTWVEKARIDFTVEKTPAFYQVPNKLWTPENGEPEFVTRSYENRAVLYRSDTQEALSVMSNSHYVPAQPHEMVEGLMQLTEGSAYEMDVVGALKGGRVIWALAKRKEVVGTIGNDIILPYVLLLTSYDGTYARTGRLTSVRAVCQNTVSLSAMMDHKTTSKQRNSAEFSLEKANLLFDNLAQYDAGFETYLEHARAMANDRLTHDRLQAFFAKLYAPEALVDPDNWANSIVDYDRMGVSTQQQNKIAELNKFFLNSPGSDLKSANGTLWGAVNAVTYMQDHEATTRQEKRWESATIGQGNKIKDKALSLALDMLAL